MAGKGKATLGGLLAAGSLAAFVSAAAAQTSGNETLDGTIVARASLGKRTVLSSVIRAKGSFSGVGRIVEVPSEPGDLDNVLRDDLVFADGTMHLVSTSVDFEGSLDPRSCILTATIEQTAEVEGGTGKFANASGSFVGGLTARVKAARNPDGSCSEDTTVIEVDQFAAQGTLMY